MFRMRAFAAEGERQNCSSSMWKLAKDLKVGPLNYVFLSLQHEPNFISALHKRETPNTQLHLEVTKRYSEKTPFLTYPHLL